MYFLLYNYSPFWYSSTPGPLIEQRIEPITHLYRQLEYSTGVFQALQLVNLAVFDRAD